MFLILIHSCGQQFSVQDSNPHLADLNNRWKEGNNILVCVDNANININQTIKIKILIKQYYLGVAMRLCDRK